MGKTGNTTRGLMLLLVSLARIWCSRCSASLTSNSTAGTSCLPLERAALLNFKHSLAYFAGHVSSSWEGGDCCSWRRVSCDHSTGRVLKLNLYGRNHDGIVSSLLELNKSNSLVYLLELKELQYLDLSFNTIKSSIPKFMGSMKQLRYLKLSNSYIEGPVPHELGNLTNLRFLYLYNNNLSGRIPTSIGQLSKLRYLDISGNPMEGTILCETHFANLSSLTGLSMEYTSLTLHLPSDWVPPFQLQFFRAQTCKINGQFPGWLQTQTQLTELRLYNANITGPIPKWLHTMRLLKWVDLSDNQITGPPIFPINFDTIYLSNNSLSGPLIATGKSTVYSNATSVDISNNFISASLPQDLGHRFPNIVTLWISNNQIHGPIPKSLCHLHDILMLDLHKNSLSGLVPNCWTNSRRLLMLSLSHNNLEGSIPCFNNTSIMFLHLSDNMLSGEIPSCFSDHTHLYVLDIGGNQLSGIIPKWVTSEKFGNLTILRLRGNKLSGIIPSQICSLSHLQVLDLGLNRLTGSIPHCLSNLTAMISQPSYDWDGFELDEVMQGREYAYTSTLEYLVNIDLSCNSLVGYIPDEIIKLSKLTSLNLSYNNLSGTIPRNISGLRSLISLDLSKNQLRGEIPSSISELYHLSHLNLSYNNLSGQIPTGSQLQTFQDASIYAGNPYLCGDPLPKKCISNNDAGDRDEDNEEDKLEKLWLYLFVISGLATGFWGVVGSLVLKRSWRHAVFRRVEDAYDWVYVVVALRKAKLKN